MTPSTPGRPRYAVFRFDAERLLEALAEVGAQLALLRGGQSGVPMIGILRDPQRESGLALPVFSLAIARAPEDTPEGRAFHSISRKLVEHRDEVVEPESIVPLLPSILALVQECGRGDRPAAPRAYERLLVFPGGFSERVQRALKELTLFATRVRIAEIGSARDRAIALLVHDDERLGSAYRALLEAGRLEGGIPLDAYTVGARNPTTLYLSENARPSVQSLRLLLEMVGAAPALFGAAANGSDERLLAVAPTPTTDEGTADALTVFPLAGARFFDAAELLGVPQPAPRAFVRRLQPAEDARASLQSAIRDGTVRHGYRLLLRPGFRATDVDREVDRLHEQIRQLQERLAYLTTLERGRATLWRFPQRHVPLLLQAITLLGPGGVTGRVLYGFETGDGERGWHYLLFEDPSAANRLHPLLEMQSDRAEDGPRCYWLDPLWADAHDADIDHDHLLFVPEGFALSPALPSDPETPVAHLLRLMVEGLSAPHGPALPERPIYLFDPPSQAHGGGPSVHVLDRAAFGPPELAIGWLNDHLRLVERAREDHAQLEPFFDELVQGLEDSQLVARLQSEKVEAAGELARIRDEVRAEADEAERLLLAELTERFQELTERAAREQETLAARLAEFTQLAGRMSALEERETRELEPVVAAGRAQIETEARRLSDLDYQTEQLLGAARKSRARLDQLSDELERLESKREEWKRRWQS